MADGGGSSSRRRHDGDLVEAARRRLKGQRWQIWADSKGGTQFDEPISRGGLSSVRFQQGDSSSLGWGGEIPTGGFTLCWGGVEALELAGWDSNVDHLFARAGPEEKIRPPQEGLTRPGKSATTPYNRGPGRVT
ncbi:hypothetical protein TIFTF001_031098 [Ficus carica]|uniref:Uncharacterized protein n=1 Tax=Ficus carica TaxID=3494 RepID=A0AA88J5V8_FICCA|nr:hypothetical protein TIFTF001_031098 [Ficus carica]